MSSLEFFFQDVLDEVQAIARVANAFIQPSSAMVLDELHSSLESVRDEAGTRIVRWGIGERFPLRTIVSHGGYQANDEGEHNVFAEITSAWDIQRIAPAKRSQRAQRFRLVGLASTRVRLWQAAPGGCQGPCLGVFRMEIGDAASPGCHFHTQILGETNFGPFPKSMDVPRLPGLLATPPAILEFTLGELFQEGWAAHVLSQTPAMLRWAPIQKRRLRAVLAWQAGVVAGAPSSPWSTLKLAKPESDLFLEA